MIKKERKKLRDWKIINAFLGKKNEIKNTHELALNWIILIFSLIFLISTFMYSPYAIKYRGKVKVSPYIMNLAATMFISFATIIISFVFKLFYKIKKRKKEIQNEKNK